MKKIFHTQNQRNALKITFFYFLFGLIFFIINDIYITNFGDVNYHLLELGQNFSYLILSGILFYFLVYLSSRKAGSKEQDFYSLKVALYNSSFIVVITDGRGRIKEVNSRFVSLTGFTPDDVKGKNISEFGIAPQEQFLKLFENLKSKNENFAEIWFKKQNGTDYCEIATILSLQDKKTNDIDYVKISADISYLKEKERLLNIEKTKAETLNDSKTHFISSLSQEIRTPMSGIIGMTELMTFTELSKQQKDYLDIINFSSGTLLAIINDILDFSRIETGKLKLEKIDFDLRELVNKTVQVLETDARKKKLSMRVNFDGNINAKISGDPLRLNQVLLNILKNSIRQSERGTIEISVTEKSRESGKARFAFRITDSGVPISSKIIQDMRFKNNEPAITSDFEYKGIGLGFTIVKHILILMKGDITFTEDQKQGNTILMEIPFEFPAVTAVPAVQVPEIKKEVPITDINVNKSVNILVAEDNFVNQRLVKELLARKNYNVDIVDNGLKIFDLLEEKKFDIILMDIQMPVMDGLEATSIIREIEKGTGKHTPIIGITAYSVIADREKCIKAGMDDYLQKPFIKEEFYQMINKYTSS
ncbi:MAG TPA: response regulator [Ignavibacteria bacterium]